MAEALGPHQHADRRSPTGAVPLPYQQPAAGRQRDHAGFGHGAVEDVALAHEVGDEIVGRPLVDLGRRGDLLDRALVHHRDAVGQDQRLFLVVGDEDRGEAEPALQAAHLELHGLAQLAVERAERLVEQQQARVEDDGAGQRHALLLAARELPRQPLVVARELDQRQRLGDAALDLGARDVAHLQREGDVALHRQMRETARSSGTPCRCRAAPAAAR